MAATKVHLDPPPIRASANVVFPFWGYGAQFDTDLFTPLGQPDGLTPQQAKALQDAIDNLDLGHSRIFVRSEAVHDETERAALMRTVKMAQQAGANVNLTWWHGPYPPARREQLMQDFAALIEEARRTGACVTHVTIQNEVNGVKNGGIAHDPQNPIKSKQLYEQLYRDLAAALNARRDPLDPAKTLRSAIRLVGGDLVANKQNEWFWYMHEHMHDVLDGYSIHAYWPQGNFDKFEKRLDALLKLVGSLDTPAKPIKPIYVTEYGVKGTEPDKVGPKGGKSCEPGNVNGTNVEDLPEAAFEHAWFNALAPQHGCVGLAKWALYRTDGPKRPFHRWGMIDAPHKNCIRTPTYRAQWLFGKLAPRGWKPAGLGREDNVLVSAFADGNGDRSVAVLSRHETSRVVQVHNLKPGAAYFQVVWNRDERGAIHTRPRVTADASGVASVNVPPLGVVALSTRAITT